jgi:tetratricopeptide (TPR) repeat protein
VKRIFIAALVTFLVACDSGSTTNKLTAVDSAAEAKKIAREKANVHFNQAFAYIGSAKAAIGPEKAKLLENAEIELTNAIREDGEFADAFMNRGVVHMALGRMNKAEEDLRKSISLDPSKPDANYNLACLLSVSQRLDLAIDSLDMALRHGFSDVERLRNDPDLNNLRKTKEFRITLEKHKFFL